jgi:thiol-disulfide isomerase/thioredoxin
VRGDTFETRRHGRLLRQIGRGTTGFVMSLLVVCLLLIGCGEGTAESDTGAATSANANADDHPAPPDDWELPVVDAEGFAELRERTAKAGKVLVVDGWATWCGSCVAMFPQLHEAMNKRSDDVVLVSFCYDENSEGGEDYIAKARDFLVEQHAWEDAYLVDPSAKEAVGEAMSEAWDGVTLPAVFVYGPDGELAYEMLETRGEPADWVAEIAEAVDRAVESSPGQ